MRISPLPDISTPLTNPDGTMTQAWYDFFKTRSLSTLFDVSNIAPTNGQSLKFVSATGKWTPG